MNFRFIFCMLLPLASPMVREKRLYGLMQLIWYWYWNLYGLVQLISNIVRACRSVSLAKSSKMSKTTWAGMSCLTIVNGPLIVWCLHCRMSKLPALEKCEPAGEAELLLWAGCCLVEPTAQERCCLVMLMLSCDADVVSCSFASSPHYMIMSGWWNEHTNNNTTTSGWTDWYKGPEHKYEAIYQRMYESHWLPYWCQHLYSTWSTLQGWLKKC